MGLYFTRVFWEGEDRSENHVNTQVPWIVNFVYSLFLTFCDHLFTKLVTEESLILTRH